MHFYTQTLLHTNIFTQKHFFTQTRFHTNTFTHRSFYTQTLLHTRWIGFEMDRHVTDLVLALNSLETWPTLLIEIAPYSTKPL